MSLEFACVCVLSDSTGFTGTRIEARISTRARRFDRMSKFYLVPAKGCLDLDFGPLTSSPFTLFCFSLATSSTTLKKKKPPHLRFAIIVV